MQILYSLSDALFSNLIRESRGMLLVKGLSMTLQISLYSLLIGVVIGLVVAIARLTRFKLLNTICKLYVDVIRGTPMVVQLVIIYYAILGGSSLPKVLVASVAFGINSGAYVSELIRAGIQAVDRA